MSESPQLVVPDDESDASAQTLDYANLAMPREVDEVVRKNRLLITPTRVVLPPVCIKTGRNDDLVEKQWNFVWYPPLIILALFLPFGIFIVLILYLVMRKKGTLRFHVRREFVARRRYWVLGGLAVFAGGVGLCYWFVSQESYTSAAIGIGVILFSFVVMIAGGRILYPARITPTHMHLKGCGEAFLRQFDQVR